MLVNHLVKQLFQPIEWGDLEELRRGTIFEISAVIFAIAWVIMIGAYGRPEQLLVAFILLGCSIISIWLRQLNFRIALAWLVATMLTAIAFQKMLFPASPAQYYFPIVVVVSSLLVSSANVFIVAVVASGALLTVAGLQSADWLGEQQVVTPIFLTFMTASAAWIGSRQIRLALEWMRTSYARTSELLEQLRDERASLARTVKMLEDAYVRIEKMNYALIEARGVAENARQLKAEFAANISHELRTPLNLIIGFSETMANAPETYTGVTWSPALRGDIEQIYQSSRHLAGFIDDILDLSALDAQRLGLTLQDAAIGDVIAEAIAVMQDLFRAKKLYLEAKLEPDLPHVRIDVTRVRQVLINLLTNASRFTRDGGVKITARWIANQVEVAVQDTGIGIAPHDVTKVFEEFGQVDGSTTRKHEGTGLGVPLSKRLVESHGGQMWLKSEVGIGTAFYFTLPALASSTMPGVVVAASHSLAPVPAYRKVIVVYDPDPLLIRTMRRHLSRYDVIQAREEKEIAGLIEHHQPIALVVHAQDKKAALALDVPADLPIVHVALIGNLRAAQALGAQNYLIKPVLREQLLDAIAGLDQPIRHVLVADDDSELVDLFARMLQSAGGMYHPIKAYGGKEALARMQGESVDLVLLDIFMPDQNGILVLEEMKKNPALATIPVVIISAQQPGMTSDTGLFIQLVRAADASTTETLNYLQVLMEALPVRGLPMPASAPALPPTRAGPPAF